MKITNVNVLKSGWIVITIFYSSLLLAQPYSGGSNSGANIGNTVAVNCVVSRYFGGNNAGSVAFNTNLLNCTTTRFSGDAGAGNTVFATANSDCSTVRFSGNAEDGSSNSKTANFDCTPLRFFGDTSDGAIASATNLLNCTNERFSGDTADGFASAKFLLIQNFLGEDTSAIIVCTNDGFNLLNLYSTPAHLIYNWNSPTPTAAGLGTYRLIATNQSGCVDTALALIKQDIVLWNGAISNNWHTAANWNSGKIPTELSHVIIPGGTANPCQIADGDATAASIQARSSGSFTIINNKKLVVSGTCIALPTGQ